jgi:PST family polysaccharide transporter
MLKKLKYMLAGTGEKKRLTSNIAYLSILQFANSFLPLLSVPYLVRILGPEYFGLIAFSTATVTFFSLLTDYGFNLSATRQIAINRENQTKVNEIFSAVMTIKLALLIISFGLMVLLVIFFEPFSRHPEIYVITFGMVIGNTLFPIWLFQGMEEMKYITYLNLGAKLFFTLCIFIFVKEKQDYLMVPLLTAIGCIVSGICALFLTKRKFQVCFSWQNRKILKCQLSEGWNIFISTLATNIYTISATIILGFFTNNFIVGYFSAAEKIIQAVKGIYAPISQAIYPMVAKKLNDDRQAGLAFLRTTTWLIGTAMLIISALLFALAEPIVNLFLGDQYSQSIKLLRVMAFLPFIVALSNILGIQTMLNLGYKKAFSNILVSASFLAIGLSVVLVPIYQGLGTAMTLVTVEVFVTAVMYIYLTRRKWSKC